MEEQSRRAFSSNFQHFWFSPYKGHLNLVLCFAHAGSSILSNKSRICLLFVFSFSKDQMVQTDYNITGFMIHSCPIFLPRSKVFERTHKVSGRNIWRPACRPYVDQPTNQPLPLGDIINRWYFAFAQINWEGQFSTAPTAVTDYILVQLKEKQLYWSAGEHNCNKVQLFAPNLKQRCTVCSAQRTVSEPL